MCQANDLPLSLKGDTFNAFTSDFDALLRRTLQGMVDTEQETGEITCKVKITLAKDSAPDFSVRNQTREVDKPKFEHTVSSVIQRKDKKSGTLAGNYELVWDRESCQYVMRPIDNGQTSLFEEGAKSEPTAVVADEPTVLEGKKVLGLPAAHIEENAPTPFERMRDFIGSELNIMEAMGTYTVRTSNNSVVLSSAKGTNGIIYCSAEKLAPHIGHEISCTSTTDMGGIIGSICIECLECDEIIFSVEAPENEDVIDAEYTIVDDESDDEDAGDCAEDDGYDYEAPEGGDDEQEAKDEEID